MRDEKNNGQPYTEVMQIGLYTTDPKEVKELAERVGKFNHNRMSNVVLDVQPREKGDALYPDGPYFQVRLTFPNSDVQEAFWLE